MSTTRTIMTCLAAAAASMFATTWAAEDTAVEARAAEVHFQNVRNQPIGEAVLRETPNGLLIAVALRDLPPGEHGFHVHETGRCLPPFESAGAHFDPAGARHGFLTEGGAHLGDLPNLVVPDDGRVRLELLMPGVTLEGDGGAALLDADGSAFVIHAGPDDYHTDPAGAAGDRIACGVVARAHQATMRDGHLTAKTVERDATKIPAPDQDAPTGR
jgi:Cu-Zn family superoxide dismutase